MTPDQTALALGLTFLAPLAGIVALSVATPVLIVLYLLKLRRRPARISSTLLWEQAVQDLQANVPFRLVRPSWLLLLQILILALLILALARPAIDMAGPGGDRMVILIDASASMAATDGTVADGPTPTRLDDARSIADRLVRRLRTGGSRAIVISFGARPTPRTEWTGDLGMLRDAIGQIQQTDQPADFDAALAAVDAFLRAPVTGEPADDMPPGTLVIISDGDLRQSPTSSAGLGDTSIDFRRVGPPPDGDRDNLGIVALSARRSTDDPSLVHAFVRIENASVRGRAVGVLATVDGDAVGAATLDVPGRSADGEAGSASHTFELRVERGVLLVRLAADDRLAADNAAGIEILPARRVRIALVTPGDRATEPEWALFDALDAADPASIERFDPGAFGVLADAGGLAKRFDLVVFDRVSPDEPPPTPTLSFGAGLPLPGLVLEPAPGPARTEGFAFWQRAHPVMRGVSLNSVLVRGAPVLRLPTGGADGLRVRPTVLASGADGPLIGLIEARGLRRLVVAPSIAQTNWRTDRSFPVFVGNAAEYLSQLGAGRGADATTTTDSAAIGVGPEYQTLTVRGPGVRRTGVPVGEGGRVELGVLPRAGVYDVLPPSGDEPLASIPVNLLSSGESSIRTSDSVSIGGRDAATGGAAGRSQREIWHWLVLGAAILQCFEWFLFSMRSRI